MTLAWLCIGWVLASAGVAMLPMRWQYVPGLALLLAAPMLIWLIWVRVSPWAALAGLAAFLSMYRNPLRYFWALARGRRPEEPPR